MQTLYLDLISGISGDMFIGALLDLGVDARSFETELSRLPLSGYHLHITRSQRAGIVGTRFDVHVGSAEVQPEHDQTHAHHHTHATPHGHAHEHHRETTSGTLGPRSPTSEHHRTFAEIKALIARSGLSDWVKQKSTAIFERLAIAEGAIHGLPPDQVHFHEVGAIDSIVDIAGACIALELLGKPRVLAGNVVEGSGWVDCAHGRFPIPVPATLAILGARGIPLSQSDEPHELVTPTGAALLAELVEQFGLMHRLVAHRIGFGLGGRDLHPRPNVLRAVLGETSASAVPHDWETDTVAVLETNLDDIPAELLGNFVAKAFAAGALDVFHTPIQMKKDRPGALLTVLCAEADADEFCRLILSETTSFGVRRYSAERRKLRREFISVSTRFGQVTVKLGRLDGKVLQAAPEFESCRKAAAEANVPLKQVYEATLNNLPPGTTG